MIVGNVRGMTIHLKNGNTIYFTEDEIQLHVVKTSVTDDETNKSTDVEYYMITTTTVER